MIEYTAKNIAGQEFTIMAQIPQLIIEEVQVAMPGNAEAYIAGAYSWKRLETNSDLRPLIDGHPFVLEANADEGYKWILEDCYVCVDQKSVYVKQARQVKV